MFIHARHSFREKAVKEVRILTLSSYLPALKTWHMLLEAQGYQAISFVIGEDFEELFKSEKGPFDVIILGHSVDDTLKKKLVEAFRKCWPAPIISVPSRAGEPTDGADIHTEPDPEELLNAIANVVRTKAHPVSAG